MAAVDVIITLLLFFSALFFLAGTVGMLRFPDVYTRLHALTKADNLGLGFLVLALILHSASVAFAAKYLLVWLLIMFSSSFAAFLVAHAARRKGSPLWKRSP
jgi:multicomponent Na+:H+ antiporter subunit G